MFEKELKINKYPYLGYSENLMECFSIVGYEESILPQIIQENKKDNNYLYRPAVLSSIISKQDFGIIDNDLIISQIFPSNPKFINITNSQNSGKNSIIPPIPKSKNIIYSFMIDSPDGKKKLFYTCFGYIFYEKYKYYDSNNNLFSLEEYYIPKAFCIISQYSYFSFFHYICKNIQNMINKNNQIIPMEIIIYNFVNFLPSPLHYNINYNIFSYELNFPSYNITQMSGYPYLDFNLTEIFSILPLNMILEIFLFTFLEQSILFFSSDLEILNMVMFIMYSLNYPCNNSTYFWHVVSIDKNSINEENRFVSQILTSLLGINASYDDSINTFPFGDYHFIVDIDNKKLIFKEKNNLDIEIKKEVEQLSKLKSYFQNIIKEKNVESLYLKNYIELLKKSIENILSKEELNSKSKKEINFFTGEKENNKLIQEVFYNFILNILMMFYEDINFNVTYDKVKFEQFKMKNENENEKVTEEDIFFELFKTTSKYKIYFQNFIQNFEPHELYKIPLIFCDEFINLKNRSSKNKMKLKIPFFNIIDSFYFTSTNCLNLNLNNFYYQYKESNIKNYFKEGNIQLNENNENNNDLKLFIFRKNILHKYVYFLNNIYSQEKLKDLFPSMKIKKEAIYQFDRRIIPMIILNCLDKNNSIKTSNYLIYSLIYIFSILMSLYSYKNLLYYIDKLFEPMKKLDFFFRFFCLIIIQTFSKYYLINKETQKYPEMKYTNIKIYFYLFLTHLKEENILPNKELFIIQKKIFGKNMFKERASFKEKNINLEMEIIDYKQQDIEFDLKDKNIFQIFMKYNFGYKGYYKPNIIIRAAIKEKGNYNIVFKNETSKNANPENKRKTPIIVTKIKDNIYTSELYTPKKIFKLSYALYNDFINNSKLDLENVNIKLLREILVNLIQYSIELKELNISYEFLINGLYLTRDLSDKFRINSIKSIYTNINK